MSEDTFNALSGIEEQLTRVAAALEREVVAEPTLMPLLASTQPYACPTCDGTGVNPHTQTSCDDCEGDGDLMLSAIREIRNNQMAMTKALNRIASAVEHLAEVRHG